MYHMAINRKSDFLHGIVSGISGGVSGLIDNVRMVAMTAKRQQEPTIEQVTPMVEAVPEVVGEDLVAVDESGLLPESSLTRMLRNNHLLPLWFTERPDLEISG